MTEKINSISEELKKKIRDVPDFPKKGIIFKDITTLLKEPESFREVIELLAGEMKETGVEAVCGIESRGFIFGSALAFKLGTGFIPIRKKGKLPAETVSVTYSLEYGEDTIEMHRDAIKPGMKVAIVDDLLATGGTAAAAVSLVKKMEGRVAGVFFAIELSFLEGRKRLEGEKVFSLMKF